MSVETLGKTIRTLRKEWELTQAQLAEQVGISLDELKERGFDDSCVLSAKSMSD